ncbi:MAG: virulence RhuM family protein [Methylophilaceae bacterium]|nr:virulence RhuM family protein [Methylophilaceae bacterium]
MTKSASEMIIYQSEDGKIRLETRLENETLWMTQSQMAELFQTSVANINIHIKNILDEGELLESATIKDFLIVRLEGQREVQRNIAHYNLDMVISVGYRVKSVIATRFRIWATQQLKEFIIKGFVMDDERLKNPPVGQSVVPDYFAEMLERVRNIRASERRVYLRVREIFALAADYEPTLAETTQFFSVIQNKLHFAATGMAAAELIASRADHAKPNMGLNTWQKDEVRKTDVLIAKNYLAETEVTELNRIVTMWLDFAEDQATRRKQVFMQDWADKLDDFLRFNDRAVLNNAGRVSKKQAEAKANLEYDKFAETRRVIKEKQAEADYFNQLAGVTKKDKD